MQQGGQDSDSGMLSVCCKVDRKGIVEWWQHIARQGRVVGKKV